MILKKNRSIPKEVTRESDASPLGRLTDLVALMLIKNEPPAEKLRILSVAGYSAGEIARLLGTSPNAVNVALHRLRKKK